MLAVAVALMEKMLEVSVIVWWRGDDGGDDGDDADNGDARDNGSDGDDGDDDEEGGNDHGDGHDPRMVLLDSC